jgi:hypothetical protein
MRCASAGDYNFLIGSLLNIASITRETRGKSRQLAVVGQLRSAHRLVRQAFRARQRTDRMAAACHEHSLARHATASSAGFLIQIQEDSYYVKRLRIFLIIRFASYSRRDPNFQKKPQCSFEKEGVCNICKASQCTRGAFESNR